MMLVSILNWNGTEDTVACLAGIERQHQSRIRFAVLDNGSQIDPSRELQTRFPDVELFRVPHNLGFTGGHNRLIQEAIDRGYGSVLILNNDCEIDIQSIVELQKTMDGNPQVAVVSSLIYRSGPERRALMVAGWIDWAQQLSIRPSSPDAVKPAHSPTLLVGTALLLRCSAMQIIGLLDDRYFAYYDDNDLSARLAVAGLQAVYCNTSICLHRYKALHEHSAMALYLMSRNQWLFWNTHTPAEYRSGLTRRLLAQSLHDLTLLRKNYASQDKQNAIVDGWWDAWHGRFGPPPTTRSSPWWIRKLAFNAPYFLIEFLRKPNFKARLFRHRFK
jgi:GT2 family glycosyltransferase